MEGFPSSPHVLCIWEYNPTGSLHEDVESAMGVLEHLAVWFSNPSTVSYLAGNAGLTKWLGHCYGALASSIDKLPGSTSAEPPRSSSSTLPPAGDSVAPYAASTTPSQFAPSVSDQDTIMVTPCPVRRCVQRSGPVPVPSDTAPYIPAAAVTHSQPAPPPPASARCSYAQAASSLPPPVSQDVCSNGEALVLLTKAYPSLPANKVLDLHQQHRFFVCYHHLCPRVRVTLATHSLAASTITRQPWLGFLQEFISR